MIGLLTREWRTRPSSTVWGSAVHDYMIGEFPRVAPRRAALGGAAADGGAEPGLPPVVKGKRLHGAITRADPCCGTPTRTSSPGRRSPPRTIASLPVRASHRGPPSRESAAPRVQSLLRLAGTVADEAGTRVYTVEALVRDLLLRHENLDVDPGGGRGWDRLCRAGWARVFPPR